MSDVPDPDLVELAHQMFDLARNGETELLTAYVQEGVPVDLTDSAGNTLLMLAAYHGHADTAYRILQQPDYPGWGYMNARGATTIWERWDGIRTDAFRSNRIGIGRGLGGMVAQTGDSYMTSDYLHDMRFSHDKSPYKTHFSASLTASGLKKPSSGGGPAYYFHIDADGQLLIAGGEYMPPSDRLRAIRQRVIEDAAGFSKVLRNKSIKDNYGGLQEEGKLTRPPKGFDADSPHLEYIKLKNFIVWKESSLKKKIPADIGKEVLAGFKDAYPLVSWLRQVPLIIAE